MFVGQWETTLDNKWRLTLPREVAKQFNKSLLLKEGKNCLEIHKPRTIISKKEAPFTSLQNIKIQKIQKGKKNQYKEAVKRVVIPPFLRDSNSFTCGATVTLAGRNTYLEIWPRPQE